MVSHYTTNILQKFIKFLFTVKKRKSMQSSILRTAWGTSLMVFYKHCDQQFLHGLLNLLVDVDNHRIIGKHSITFSKFFHHTILIFSTKLNHKSQQFNYKNRKKKSNNELSRSKPSNLSIDLSIINSIQDFLNKN